MLYQSWHDRLWWNCHYEWPSGPQEVWAKIDGERHGIMHGSYRTHVNSAKSGPIEPERVFQLWTDRDPLPRTLRMEETLLRQEPLFVRISVYYVQSKGAIPMLDSRLIKGESHSARVGHDGRRCMWQERCRSVQGFVSVWKSSCKPHGKVGD